jgi:GrpB-like predicted nucleotidyltransferase (UPF0157 family)
MAAADPVTLLDVAEVKDTADDMVAAFETEWRDRLGGAEIHHIGATALPSGRTKGDVDVNLRVPADRFDAVVAELSARLAVAQPENWTPTFASFSAPGYELPLGVQVTVLGSAGDFLIALRDRLRTDPELLRRYDELKARAAAGGADAYWQAKNRFLQELRQVGSSTMTGIRRPEFS